MRWVLGLVLPLVVVHSFGAEAAAGGDPREDAEEGGEAPVVDTTRSEFSTELDEALLQNLPVGRSTREVLDIVPGVYGRIDTELGGPGAANPSVRGEGAQGNNVWIDGMPSRDPATKGFGLDLPYDTLESIRVYTDGAPAEYGRATGMMVDVVTRSGGDAHHGTAGIYASQDAWFDRDYDLLDLENGEEVPTQKPTFHHIEIPFTLGGPLQKGKVWYFAALTLERESILANDAQVTYHGAGFGKLTWFLTPTLTLQVQSTVDGLRRDDILDPLLNTPEAQQDRNELFQGHLLTATWRPYRTGEFALKAGYQHVDLDLIPSGGSAEAPRFYDSATGVASGNADRYDREDRTRLGASLDFTQQLEDIAGDHRIKTGVSFWQPYSGREVQHTGGVAGLDGLVYLVDAEAGYPCETDLDGDGVLDDCVGLEGRHDVGAVGNVTRLYAAFLQDDWAPFDALTFNLGFRLDVEEALNNDGEHVFTQVQPAPRTGLAWDVTGDGRTVISANYGRYFDIHGSLLSSWGNTLSPTNARVLEYAPAFHPPSDPHDPIYEDGTTPYFPYYVPDHVSDPVVTPITFCTEDGLARLTDHLSQVRPQDTGEEIRAYVDEIDERYCNGRLIPYHMDKVAVRVEREILPNLSLGVRGIWSQTVNLPEDLDVDLDSWIVSSRVKKRRDYRALELTATRKHDGRWSALASWTISASKGHMPGQFEQPSGGQVGGEGNGVGLFLDSINDPDARAFYDEWLGFQFSDPTSDPALVEHSGHTMYRTYADIFEGMGTVDDDQGYYGYLPTHAFHQVKVNGFYTFPFGTTVGLVYAFDSGHAWEKRGFQRVYRDFATFPEGRGSRFMPAVHYIDLRLAHTIEIDELRDMEISLDIFNVPGLKAPVTTYANDVEGLFGKTLYRQAPRSMRLGAKYTF